MVLYYLRNYMDRGKAPNQMIDPNNNVRKQAVEQIHRYAEAPRVEALRQGTELHKIIMQFEGWELKRTEEV